MPICFLYFGHSVAVRECYFILQAVKNNLLPSPININFAEADGVALLEALAAIKFVVSSEELGVRSTQ